MGPLSGIKIIELKGIGPAPHAGMLLSDLGADVVVVERSSHPSSIAASVEFDVTSRGKRSIALDLKREEGVEALLQLVEKADVLLEGFRPGVTERLGFGPDECMARNPGLIYGRMTGWGQTGPLSHSAGHDCNYISLTGIAASIGPKERPVFPLNFVGDFGGGSMYLVVGILAALIERQSSGKGEVIDAAITDGSAHLMSMFYSLDKLGAWNTNRVDNLLDGGRPYYRAYDTSDGKHVSVGAIEPQFFAELLDKLGLPHTMAADQNNPAAFAEIESAFEKAFIAKTRGEWVDIFEGSDACVAGILDYKEAFEHPHNKARETYIELDGVKQPAPAPRFSRSQCDTPAPPKPAGADGVSAFRAWGVSEDAIEALEKSGALT